MFILTIKQRTLSAVIPAKAGIHRIERKKKTTTDREEIPENQNWVLAFAGTTWHGAVGALNGVKVILELDEIASSLRFLAKIVRKKFLIGRF